MAVGFQNYPGKRLCDVVFPGSHDAGITSGLGNAKTQSLDIEAQANAGCRWFDLRLLKTTPFGKKSSTHSKFKTYHIAGVAGKKTSRATRLLGGLQGTFGLSLDKIIDGAHKFLNVNGAEFLLFRFSKCQHHADLFNELKNGLSYRLFKGAVNLNEITVDDQRIRGKVVVLFDDGELNKVGATPQEGCLGVKSLFAYGLDSKGKETKDLAPKPYVANYNGIQYFGKFGATTTKTDIGPNGSKFRTNLKKQENYLTKGGWTYRATPEVLGMMYWTTTGVFQNILSRNQRMWNQVHSRALVTLWEQGLEEALTSRVGYLSSPLIQGQVSSFIPNIVMMDDVNSGRCELVWQLNRCTNGTILAVNSNAEYIRDHIGGDL